MVKTTRFRIFFILLLIYALALKLSFSMDVDDRIISMLPDSDKEVEDFTFMLEHLSLLDAVYIDIYAPAAEGAAPMGMDQPVHAQDKNLSNRTGKAADDFFHAIKSSDFFKEVVYKIPAGDFFNLVDLINEKKQYLIHGADLSELEAQMNQEKISSLLTDLKRKLLGLKGMFLSSRIQKDPFDISGIVMKKIENLNPVSSSITIEEGRITGGPGGNHILMLAYPNFPAADTSRGEEMLDFLNKTRTNIETSRQGIKVGLAGNHIATLDNALTIQRDVKRTVIVISLAIIAIGFLFFSRKIFIVLIFFPALFGITISSAVISIFNPNVSGVALGCGAVLVGITVDFGIHFLFHLDASYHPDSMPHPDSIRLTFTRLYKPLATCAGTTSLALFSLIFSSIPGQRQMGIFSGIAVITAALFAAFALIHFIPGQEKKSSPPIFDLVSWCCRILETGRGLGRVVVIPAALTIFAMSLYGLSQFEFQGDIKELNHLNAEVQRDMDMFLETWGGEPSVTAIVKGNTLQEALLNNDRLYALLKEYRNENQIDNISSLSPILPSFHTQEENRAGWNKFWNRAFVEKLKDILDIEIEKHKFTPEIFALFYKELKSEATLIKSNDFKATALKDLISSRLLSPPHLAGGDTLIITTFESFPHTDLGQLKTAVSNKLPGTIIFAPRYFTKHITKTVSKEFMKIAAIAVFVIFTALFMFMGKLKLVFVSLMPVILGGIVTLGILGLAGISINLISVLFIVFVFGVGVDFSVFLLHQRLFHMERENGSGAENGNGVENGERHLAVTCASVIICALTTMAAFTSLLFAHHNALRSIGAAGLTGMISCLVFSMTIIPSISMGEKKASFILFQK